MFILTNSRFGTSFNLLYLTNNSIEVPCFGKKMFKEKREKWCNLIQGSRGLAVFILKMFVIGHYLSLTHLQLNFTLLSDVHPHNIGVGCWELN